MAASLVLLESTKAWRRLSSSAVSARSLRLLSPGCENGTAPASSSTTIRRTAFPSRQPQRNFSQQQQPQRESQDPAYRHRHGGIQPHPDSIGATIRPGNQVVRTLPSGKVHSRYTELVHGYFWMLKDLKRCGEKPLLSNETLIRESDAKLFPSLQGPLKTLSGVTVADLHAHCLRKNRSRDAAAQCTLIGVSFRDFGFQQLASWIEPFDAALGGKDRYEVLKINIAEGWFNRWILRAFIIGSTKMNTPKEEHDRTLLYFGKNTVLESFRDALRMHNVLTGYVFLLDGLGRVRFAGSGVATEEEAARLVRLAQQLTPVSSSSSGRGNGRSPAASRNFHKRRSTRASAVSRRR